MGFITKSCFTTNPLHDVDLGERLLLDIPPNPPEYTPGLSKPIRIEPVSPAATQIEYIIVEENNPRIYNNEVQL